MPHPLDSVYGQAETSPGFLLWLVSNRWQRRQREALAPLDLTHVQYVLLASLTDLSGQGGAVTQSRLALHTGTDEMMTSQVLRALERKGFVERGVHPTDARARALRVTEAGRQLARAATAQVEATDEAFFAALGNRVPDFTALLRELAGTG